MTNIILRKKNSSQFSIEEIFNNLIKSNKLSNVNKVVVPHNKLNIRNILQNILFIKKYYNEVNHVTGDIHYLVPFLGKKTILTVHDIQSTFKGSKINIFIKKIFWYYIPFIFAKEITAISVKTYEEILSLAPWVKYKLSIINNPIDIETCKIKRTLIKNDRSILIIGTKKNKNIIRIFESIKNLNTHVNIIGELNDSQLNIAIKNKINFNQYIDLSYDEVLNLYAKSYILCFPSLYEGFGMPIIEAQAIGTPVITSNLSPMNQISNNDNSILVNPYSVLEITNAIKKLLKDEHLYQKLQKNGFENVNKYSLNRIANKYKLLYNKIRIS
ncbi:glycosyltransferase [Flammeovirga kamogawensis]|uniref:Glycosyltransferase n=1 Tax=Flammeovirga kamogawensis TaxID=373891 RepID=A0ABX8GYI2_9BACT|nr:glycosyltransferase [Flammeovirga kamogawensis]MBB6458898.1 glycosyltransferase involved in cell wall biosynthesis [Flammeovirga kamogawensis]QWG08479.1 glycosyltransferase [Flammeovirga kamogawensis]TRX66774.1 glycosyltransferase family 4 protein [Flammeovirga kamogawensis]